MDKLKTTKVISAIMLAGAVLVIIGWLFDIPTLRSIIPGAISMRMMTAISFIFVSILLYSLVKIEEGKNETSFYMVLLTVSSSSIMLCMTIGFFNILGVTFNLEGLINTNYLDHTKTFPTLTPSIGTILLFVLISISGFANLLTGISSKKLTKSTGVIVSIISIFALLGYVLKVPALSFAITDISVPMAINTAFLFLLSGIALILFSKTEHSNTFTNSYSISQKLSIGFSIVISLITLLIVISSIINRENLISATLNINVEEPLQRMFERIINYDAVLTGAVHEAILHAITEEHSDLEAHKAEYEEVGIKLDNILKYEVRALLEKSQRGTDDKKKVYEHITKLDELNEALVKLEFAAFAALEKGDIETAKKLTGDKQYDLYKAQFADHYTQLLSGERRVDEGYHDRIIINSQYIARAELILGLLIVIAGILLSKYILKSINSPISKLNHVAKEISAGNIDVKIPAEIKRIPGMIGDVANSFDKLLESSHTALTAMVQNKTSKFEKMFSESQDALMTLAPPSWNFVLGNKATLKMFDVKDEKTFNKLPPWELSPKTQPDGQLSSVKAKKMIEKAMKEGSNEFEWTHKRYKGKDFPTTVLLSRVGSGKDTYIQATVRDLSKEKRSSR